MVLPYSSEYYSADDISVLTFEGIESRPLISDSVLAAECSLIIYPARANRNKLKVSTRNRQKFRSSS